MGSALGTSITYSRYVDPWPCVSGCLIGTSKGPEITKSIRFFSRRRRIIVGVGSRCRSCALSDSIAAKRMNGSIQEPFSMGDEGTVPLRGRRELILSTLLFNLSALRGSTAADIADAAPAAEDTAQLPLEVYSDSTNGFTMQYPAVWSKVDKPGAVIFFEDPKSRANNIGVTVNPVRIASLRDFGTLDDVTDKLIRAERDKPSTKDMQVVRVLERQLQNDTPLYQLEYSLDTSRGSKRVLTAVTVAAYKLYILSIVYADGSVTPASVELDNALHEVLSSFDLVSA